MPAFRTAGARALPILVAALLPPLLLPLPAQAERFALATDRDAAYYAVTLDADVYTHSARAGLGDLRVRNGAGELLPYALDLPPEPAAEARTLRDVPWFALPAAQSRQAAPMGVVIGTDGALRAASTPPAAGTAGAWLLDLSQLRDDASAVVIGLPEGDYQGRVDVASSDDLQHWQPAGGAQLLRLSREGSSLSQDRIALGRLRARYLRLQWQGAPPAPARVQVETVALSMPSPLALQWRDGIVATQAQPGGDYLFDSGGRFPAERVRIRLPQSNTVVQATLWSRPDAQSSWRMVSRGQLYRLAGAQGTEQESAQLAIGRNTDRLWRLSVEARAGGLGAGMPLLALGWRPAVVTFVARGAPPFSLAVGEPAGAAQEPGAVARAELLAGPAPVIAEARITAMTASPQAAAVPADTQRNRRFVLWGALLLAVGVLGLMAWRLLRALGAQPPPPD
ncbi:hypothetical protein OR16_08196 [Cupriavidus basilensis OR16]|uniref:Transmembrane protein n=1 Tax=Cupriavidus basilensis OR16 TaxID=1127483 RepID=H1S1U2_9BURK|nr:DUF3999 domain-containing protein [Cupriavidus basilensis]EHP43667.1 hypothetical protein OR16_08196 [Cupriavidus basilensis OR16]